VSELLEREKVYPGFWSKLTDYKSRGRKEIIFTQGRGGRPLPGIFLQGSEKTMVPLRELKGPKYGEGASCKTGGGISNLRRREGKMGVYTIMRALKKKAPGRRGEATTALAGLGRAEILSD